MAKYEKGKHIVYRCVYHVILCTKYRIKFLKGKIRYRLFKLLREKQVEYGYKIICMEIMPNHVHILMNIRPDLQINKTIGKIKGYTSYILRQEFQFLNNYKSLWTRAKFASSIGQISENIALQYVKNQYKNYNKTFNKS